MSSNSRMYPISKEVFDREILPIIERETNRSGGRPPKIPHYVFFCAVLKMLSISVPWRDCPKEYGDWHTIYTRFKRWSENGLLWKILNQLRANKQATIQVLFMDSTTIKIHRHGTGALKKEALRV